MVHGWGQQQCCLQPTSRLHEEDTLKCCPPTIHPLTHCHWTTWMCRLAWPWLLYLHLVWFRDPSIKPSHEERSGNQTNLHQTMAWMFYFHQITAWLVEVEWRYWLDIDGLIEVNIDPDDLLSLSPAWRLFSQKSHLPVSYIRQDSSHVIWHAFHRPFEQHALLCLSLPSLPHLFFSCFPSTWNPMKIGSRPK